jgi:hypothetical protein
MRKNPDACTSFTFGMTEPLFGGMPAVVWKTLPDVCLPLDDRG